jgi:hypothetical protein
VGTSLSRIEEILDYASDTGDMEAQRIFGISHETLRRYRRRMKLSKEPIKGTAIGFDPSVERMLQEIGARYSPEEIRIIAQGMRPGGHGRRKITADWFSGDSMTFGVISDTHIGSSYFREDCGWTERLKCSPAATLILSFTRETSEGLSQQARACIMSFLISAMHNRKKRQSGR